MHDCLDLGASQVGLTQARKGAGVLANPCHPALQHPHLRPSTNDFCAAQANFVAVAGKGNVGSHQARRREIRECCSGGDGANWAEGGLRETSRRGRVRTERQLTP